MLINEPANPLTKAQIVEATLAFVDGASIAINRYEPGPSIDEFIFRARKFRELTNDGAVGPFVVLIPASIATAEDLYSHLRTSVATVLGQSLTNPIGTAEMIGQDGFQLIPGCNFGSGRTRHVRLHSQSGYRLTTYYEFANPIQLIEWGLLLILDGAMGFREKLRRCKRCARFFLEVKPKTGRPNNIYCQTGCMEAFHNSGGAARMRALRSRKIEKRAGRKARAGAK
jgi:hypothetical protein